MSRGVYQKASTYHAIVEGFIEGLADYYGTDTLNKIRLIPASFQAHHDENTATANVFDINSWKDYINTRLPASSKCELQGINLHLYSNTIQGSNLTLNSSFPEKVAQSGTQTTALSHFFYVRNAWKWLKDNQMAHKNIYITEFGWDSDGCTPDKAVGVKTQAIYTIRNLLMMGRYGVKKANLYQIEDDPTVGCDFAYFSSGVFDTKIAPKYIFKALENFIQKTGTTKFHYALREDPNDVHAYILEQQDQPKYMVAWLARDINYTDDTKTLSQVIALGGADLSDGVGAFKTIDLSFNGTTYTPDANLPWYRLDGETIAPLSQATFFSGGQYKLSPVPILIPIVSACNPDAQAPVFANCPTHINQTTTGTTAIVNWTPPTATDNCTATPTVTSTHNVGAAFPIGTTTVVYTAKDASNNTATCSFNVSVTNPCATDAVKPVFANCPTNISRITTKTITDTVSWTVPTATDNCSTPSVTSTHNVGATFPLGTTTVTYTAQDANNNTATCVFTITLSNPCLNDIVAPVFDNCPTDIIQTITSTSDTVIWTPPTVTDNCTATPTLTSSHNSGTRFPIGETIVTYTAKDAKNNTTTCTFKITILNPCLTDTTAPIFSNCPGNITKITTDTAAIATWSPPVASDNCAESPSVISTHVSGASFKIGITTVTYTATDNANNKSTCIFTVTVSPQNANYCGSKASEPYQEWISGVTFGTINNTNQANQGKSINWTVVGYSDFTNLITPVNRGQSYPLSIMPSLSWSGRLPDLYCRVWIDYNGNRVFDDTEKVLEGRALNPFTSNVTIPMSAISGNTRMRVSLKWGGFPTPCENFTPGEVEDYVVNIGGTDCSTDTQLPVLSACPTNISLTTSGTTATATWTPPTATDNCGIPSVTTTHVSGTVFPIGTTTVTYTATDAKNNKSTCSFTVTVINSCATDIIKPVLSACPTNISLTTTGTTATATWTPPTATDNCSIPSVTTTHISGTVFSIGTTTVTYTATDAKNNIATCSFTITVSPQNANYCASKASEPYQEWVSGVIFGTINNTNQANQGKSINWSVIGYSDFTNLTTTVNRGQSYPLSILPSLSWSGRLPDLYCRVWIDYNGDRVFDDTEKVLEGRAQNPFNSNVTIPMSAVSGNTRMRVSLKWGGFPTACESFTPGEVEDYVVNIGGIDCSTDAEPPVFANCPANISLTTTGTTATATWAAPSATDNCTPPPVVTSSHNSGAAFPIGTTTVTYTATDAKNNKATCTFTITVSPQNTNYCGSKASEPYQEWVKGVQLESINNTNQTNEGKTINGSVIGYSDFTNWAASLTRGQNYPLSILPGISWVGRLPDLYCRVWIDYNNNKIFEDTEKVLEGRALNPFTSTVAIPVAATLGTTRMRVSLKSGSLPTACENYTSGEVEDYTVIIR